MSPRGDGSVYRKDGSRFYYVSVWHRGRQVTRSTGETTLPAAHRFRRRLLADLQAGAASARRFSRTTLADLAALMENDYALKGRSSWKRAAQALAHLYEYFGRDFPAESMTPGKVQEYLIHRLGSAAEQRAAARGAPPRKLAMPATVEKELAALTRMFNLGRKYELTGVDPARFDKLNVGDSNAVKDMWSRAELDALCAHLPEAMADACRFAYITGWRREEILGLTLTDIDRGRGAVRLGAGRTKNRLAKAFPFGTAERELHPWLREIVERRIRSALAVSRHTGELCSHLFHREGAPIRTFRKEWESALEQIGMIDDEKTGRARYAKTFHMFRNTACTNMDNAGIKRTAIMAMVGLKTEAIFRRYSVVRVQDIEGFAPAYAGFHSRELAAIQKLLEEAEA